MAEQILLKDLAARMPYGVWVHIDGVADSRLTGVYEYDKVSTERGINYPVRLVKPYLRSMDSMTDEEEDEYEIVIRRSITTQIDWLNSKHFDYRGLIPMGLALEAKKGMYN